jgi:hypothetical protein
LQPPTVLEILRRQMGSDPFSAQYQQTPIPPGGAMIKRTWVKRYACPPPSAEVLMVLQSWDTASKGGPENDWSVCTTWALTNDLRWCLPVRLGLPGWPDNRDDQPGKRAKGKRCVIRRLNTTCDDRPPTARLRYTLARQPVSAVAIRVDESLRIALDVRFHFDCSQTPCPSTTQLVIGVIRLVSRGRDLAPQEPRLRTH